MITRVAQKVPVAQKGTRLHKKSSRGKVREFHFQVFNGQRPRRTFGPANCILISKEPFALNSFLKSNGIEPTYRHEVFAAFRIIGPLSAVISRRGSLQYRQLAAISNPYPKS